MKKNIVFLLTGCMYTVVSLAQTNKQAVTTAQPSKAMSNKLSLGLSFPIEAFNRSHSTGIALEYLRSQNRFGQNSLTSPLIKFVMNGGISYHPGRTTATAGYPFSYGSYLNIYTLIGIDYKPSVPININLTTGPLISIYKGNTDLGAGINLFSDYYLSDRIAVSPGLLFRKFGKTDALWSGTIRASYAF
jgi:hypothetical protein